MQPRVSIISLGVEDLARARAFYEAMGWKASALSNDTIVFFQAGSLILGLYPRALLAKDAGAPLAAGSGATLAHNVGSKEEVDQLLADAEAAGARMGRPAQDTEWGGYSGYFFDPEGHGWEIAWNPHFPLDSSGAVRLPA